LFTRWEASSEVLQGFVGDFLECERVTNVQTETFNLTEFITEDLKENVISYERNFCQLENPYTAAELFIFPVHAFSTYCK
jgi:hypothetical protein